MSCRELTSYDRGSLFETGSTAMPFGALGSYAEAEHEAGVWTLTSFCFRMHMKEIRAVSKP
jgi:hypothetical protein